MKSSTAIHARIRRAITLYTQQAEIHSEMGACDPDEWEDMDDRFKKSRAMLERVIFEEIERAYRQANR